MRIVQIYSPKSGLRGDATLAFVMTPQSYYSLVVCLAWKGLWTWASSDLRGEKICANEKIKAFAFNHILLSRNIKGKHPLTLTWQLASFSPIFSYQLHKNVLYPWLDKIFSSIIAAKVKYSRNKPTHYSVWITVSLRPIFHRFSWHSPLTSYIWYPDRQKATKEKIP